MVSVWARIYQLILSKLAEVLHAEREERERLQAR